MQQPMVVLDAECADDEVCSLANRNAQISQRAVIPSDSRREVGPQSGTMTYWRNPRSMRAAWASSRAPWRTSSRMRSPTRSGSCTAAASSFAVAWVWRPRKCAIQTDVSTRIMACQGCDPHASRPTRLPAQSLEHRQRFDLLAYPNQQPKAFFHRCSLVEKPAADMACDINSSSISMVVRTALHWSRPAGSRSGALLCIDRGRNLNAANCLPSCNALHCQRRSRRRRSRCPRLPNE